MPQMLAFGATGNEVKALQCALNSCLPDLPVPLVPDGIFGAKTLGRIKTFQQRSRLACDGIVGPLTWRALKGEQRAIRKAEPLCACHETHDTALLRQAVAALLGDNPPVASSRGFAATGSGTRAAPTTAGLPFPTLRRPTDSERNTVKAVYGESIDFSKVFISNAIGLDNRAFVVAVSPGLGRFIQIVNIGGGVPDHRLVHEFGHVWQSQHHGNPTIFMGNSIHSRALANLTNKAFGTISYSAYAWVPGRPFSSYGAEQIAQAASNGDGAVITHMRGVPANATDSELTLTIPRIEDWMKPGVRIGLS